MSRDVKVDVVYNHSKTSVTPSRFLFHEAALKLHSLKLTPSVWEERCFSPTALTASLVRPV